MAAQGTPAEIDALVNEHARRKPWHRVKVWDTLDGQRSADCVKCDWFDTGALDDDTRSTPWA